MKNNNQKQIGVPFLDLRAQYKSIKKEIDEAIQAVIDSCAFAGGPYVERFEEEFALYCNASYSVAVGSGTEALWLALLALGVGPDDEVITVPNTFIATAEAITYTGAKPVFVDVNESYYTMNAELIEKAITKKTKVIIPVHLYGQMCEMDSIMKVANKHGLLVLEDACQAHGATYNKRKAGSIGHAGAFSFYPGKNLGAYGEAGAVVTNDKEIADKIIMLRDHGQRKKYHHELYGWNARMDGIQGAILSVKLKYLDKWNESRRRVADRYRILLEVQDSIVLPKVMEENEHVYHVYAIRLDNRDKVINLLREKEIGCGIHYPIPINEQAAYHSSMNSSYPVSTQCAKELLSLPIYSELSNKQISTISMELLEILKKSK